MQAGIDELTEKVKELGEKAKYFDAIYDKALEKSSEIIKSLTYERDELLIPPPITMTSGQSRASISANTSSSTSA